MLLSLLLSSSLFVVVVGEQQPELDVLTEYGTVRGHIVPVVLSSGQTLHITSFLGIPYARPPTGPLRFLPPQKADPWSDVFVADKLPNACMQLPTLMSFTHPKWTQYSEDCLKLNIYAPAEINELLPVMLWIHGGAFKMGAGFQYPGHFLATSGVVVVTFNYRLGVFGFASTPDATIPGNMGMLDQVLAMQFVKDNIAAFGGDPNTVTIFGESAGGHSTGLQLVSPKSKGLFHRAILESGSENGPGALNPPDRKPQTFIYEVARNAKCPIDKISEMLKCLRALTDKELETASNITCKPGHYCPEFLPVVDGPGGFMPALPLTLREELGSDTVPILSGICSDDGSLFIFDYVPEAAKGGFTRKDFLSYLRSRFVDLYNPRLSPEHAEAVCNALDYVYSPDPYLDDLDANRRAFVELLTDSRYGFPWDRTAKLNQRYADTYTYIYSYLSPNVHKGLPAWMGVTHMSELASVWGYGYLPSNPLVRNDSGIYFDIIQWTPDDVNMADYVQTLWTNFAKFGNPMPSPVHAPFDSTITTWPMYTLSDNLKVLHINRSISHIELYRQKEYAFYTRYLHQLIEKPFWKEDQ